MKPSAFIRIYIIYVYVTVLAKRGIFAYAMGIAFLLSFERVSKVLANGAIGSVIAVTDPKLRHFEIEPLPKSICNSFTSV